MYVNDILFCLEYEETKSMQIDCSYPEQFQITFNHVHICYSQIIIVMLCKTKQ